VTFISSPTTVTGEIAATNTAGDVTLGTSEAMSWTGGLAMTAIASALEGEVDVAGSVGATKRSVWDYVPRVTQAFLQRPEGYQAWRRHSGGTQAAADRRHRKLATVSAAAAARAMRRPSGGRHRATLLNRRHRDPEIATLDALDLAVVLFAAKVASSADRITESDVSSLRSMGLSDGQVFDIALAAAASCFFADAADEMAAS
jgi:hypothetical protein